MAEPLPIDTEQLIQQAAAGDANAGDALLRQHRHRLRDMVAIRMDDRLRQRVDPSDVVQDTLVAAHQQLPDYLLNRPIPFYPWLRSLALNRLIDLHRRHLVARRRSVCREVSLGISDASALALAERLSDPRSSPSQKALRDESKRRVLETLAGMPEDQREILVMRHLEGMSIEEIAAALDLPPGTVMSRHFRGLKVIRRMLKNDD